MVYDYHFWDVWSAQYPVSTSGPVETTPGRSAQTIYIWSEIEQEGLPSVDSSAQDDPLNLRSCTRTIARSRSISMLPDSPRSLFASLCTAHAFIIQHMVTPSSGYKAGFETNPSAIGLRSLPRPIHPIFFPLGCVGKNRRDTQHGTPL